MLPARHSAAGSSAAPSGSRSPGFPRGSARAAGIGSHGAGAAGLREHDTRLLGVALAGLALDGCEVALDSPALAEGWLAPEPAWRWTDGAGMVPVAGAGILAFDLLTGG